MAVDSGVAHRRRRSRGTTGDHVALEGFTHLIPVRGGHEIIRQGGATSPWSG